jgi:hypothetical protein
MLSSLSASCPMAAFIMILVIITILIDAYLLFGPAFVIPYNSSVLGVIFFLFTIVYVLFVHWLSNKTCYNFVWVSWLIAIYLLFNIVNSLDNIMNPSKRAQIQNDLDIIFKEEVSQQYV